MAEPAPPIDKQDAILIVADRRDVADFTGDVFDVVTGELAVVEPRDDYSATHLLADLATMTAIEASDRMQVWAERKEPWGDRFNKPKGHLVEYFAVDEDYTIPQLIEGWRVRCACGWESHASYAEFSRGANLIRILQRRAEQHALERTMA
jgi:hypothetical protein